MSDSCDPMDCSLPGSSVHRILQARILEWVAISFSRGSSQPRNWTWVSCIAGRFSSNWAMREATWVYLYYLATPSPEFLLSELTHGLPPSCPLLPPAMFSAQVCTCLLPVHFQPTPDWLPCSVPPGLRWDLTSSQLSTLNSLPSSPHRFSVAPYWVTPSLEGTCQLAFLTLPLPTSLTSLQISTWKNSLGLRSGLSSHFIISKQSKLFSKFQITISVSKIVSLTPS